MQNLILATAERNRLHGDVTENSFKPNWASFKTTHVTAGLGQQSAVCRGVCCRDMTLSDSDRLHERSVYALGIFALDSVTRLEWILLAMRHKDS